MLYGMRIDPGITMKLLIATIAALWVVGSVSAQSVTPPTPPANLKAPIGVKHIPEHPSPGALADRMAWEPSEQQTTWYAQVLASYEAAKAQRRSDTLLHAPADCAMILWVDTTATVPMPTLKPGPNVDPKMPILKPNMGCTRSLLAPSKPLNPSSVTPKEVPTKFPKQ